MRLLDHDRKLPLAPVLFVGCSLFTITAAAFGAGTPQPAAGPPPAVATPPTSTGSAGAFMTVPVPATGAATARRDRVKARTPMMAELLGYLDAQERAMAQQRLRIAAAGAAAAGTIAAQQDLQRLKVETELGMLRIQARWAREEGRFADATRIDAAIEQILRPFVPRNTEPRPAPAAPVR